MASNTKIATNHFHGKELPLAPVLSALASQENMDGDDGNAMMAARCLLHELYDIAKQAPELNMANYTIEEVASLNQSMTDIYLLLHEAVVIPDAP